MEETLPRQIINMYELIKREKKNNGYPLNHSFGLYECMTKCVLEAQIKFKHQPYLLMDLEHVLGNLEILVFEIKHSYGREKTVLQHN